MISIIFKLLILFYIILTVKNIIDINKYNPNSDIVYINDIELVKGKTNILDPLIINYNFNFNNNLTNIINNNIDKYDIDIYDNITKISDFNNTDNIMIFNSMKLYDINDINNINNNIKPYFYNVFNFNYKNTLSLFKGNKNTNIIKNKNNINVISVLYGDIDIYLFNPKHNNILLDNNFKKWASKINLLENTILYIPSNWKYYIESNNDTILTNLKCDNYFTFIYNEYKL